MATMTMKSPRETRPAGQAERAARRRTLVLRMGAAIVAVALVAGAAGVFWPGDGKMHLTAYFDRTVGLYEGSDVRVLGVKIGEITQVEPQDTVVRVEMEYDGNRKVPADAKAAVVAPSVVSDRYVQLAPAYTGGPVLKDGATIPLARTAVPVELDQIYGNLDQLDKALGPEGANKNGSLSRLLQVGAANLDGQGENVHQTVENLSKAVETLSDGREDMFSTVRNLQTFTTALANSDEQVQAFNDDLASVSKQLDGEREELAAALRHLSVALKQVAAFVRANRDDLAENVDGLAKVTKVLAKERNGVASILDDAPLALSNLQLAYDPVSGTLDSRADFQQTQEPVMYICSLLFSLGQPPKECEKVLSPLKQLPKDQGGVPGLDPSWLTRLSGEHGPPPELEKKALSGAGGAAKQGSSSPSTALDPTLGGILSGGGK